MSYFGRILTLKLKNKLKPFPTLTSTIEDIIQDTFLRALRAIQDNAIRDPERLGAYVTRIADLVLHEHLRATPSSFVHVDIDSLDVTDKTPAQERSLIQEETMTMVQNVMAQLSSRDRDLLRARFLNPDSPDKELAAEVGLPVEHFRVALQRAKKRLRSKLQKVKA